jgi:hypothetical protein
MAPDAVAILGVTPAGYEFVKTVENDTLWQKSKSRMLGASGVIVSTKENTPGKGLSIDWATIIKGTAEDRHPKGKRGIVIFPTPAGVGWGDVLIRFRDGHTVSIKIKSASGVYNYTQMGMANKKNSNPTKQWELLKAFAEKRGQIDWKNKQANLALKKQKQELSNRLRHFFRMDGDPIEWDKKTKSYRCHFRVLPEGDEN